MEVSYFEGIRGCVKQAREEYQAELRREQNRAQAEAMFKSGVSLHQILELELLPTKDDIARFIFDNTVDFYDMCDDYKNTVKAEQKYVYGNEIILRVRADEIKSSGDNYSYLIKHHGSLKVAHIYSNDNDFIELDYPIIVYVLAKYNSRYQDIWGTVYYEFTDARLLSYEEVPPCGY